MYIVFSNNIIVLDQSCTWRPKNVVNACYVSLKKIIHRRLRYDKILMLMEEMEIDNLI